MLGIILGIRKGRLAEKPLTDPGDKAFTEVRMVVEVKIAHEIHEVEAQVMHGDIHPVTVLLLQQMRHLGEGQGGHVQGGKGHVDQGDLCTVLMYHN